ncbi:RRQRL motif-containing zinc-binding protein [Streptomyces malaysiensis]|uniref:RRQRL motif-containing zinc-binding protein n=1 Tax=Streptomyces malaysiensis TaxID=92644 RepID=UPI0028165680|nr:RRQRL motif-containing zinc-binding protein [Streptomyces samsunensis]
MAPANRPALPAADTVTDVRDVEIYPRASSGALPQYDWDNAPEGLLTRRQLRAAGLRPGGHDPVGELKCRRCSYRPHIECTHRKPALFDRDLAKPKLRMTLAKEEALDKAMAARQTCPECRRRYHHCLPLRSLGSCLECHDGTPADPHSYTAPRNGHDLAA